VSSTLTRAEAVVAGLLTLVAIWLRLVAALSAGALWRDEANTIGLVTVPTLTDVWKNLQYDSFPMVWLVIVRGFSGLVGPTNDGAFRALGAVIGLGVVGALWFYARTLRQPSPLLSLALFGISPSLIVWGDSVRGYGFGIVSILLTGALLWRLVERPGLGRFLPAAVSAIVSVHTLFYNSVLLLAFCAGAVAVCAKNRSWKHAMSVVVIGALAAISLLPYLGAVRGASSWNILVRMPNYDLRWFFLKLNQTVSPAGFWSILVWLELFVLAIFAGTKVLRSHGDPGPTENERDVAVFSLVALVVGILGVFLFLRVLSYPTAPWYYLALLALSAVCMDALFGVWIRGNTLRLCRLSVVVLLAAVTFLPALREVRTRMTNVDLVASRIGAIAQPGDVVFVNEWYYGVSFDRYYHGRAPWMTVPEIGSHAFHRYDLIKEQMVMPDQTMPTRPVIERMTAVLRGGHRVFMVGSLVIPARGRLPAVLPPAPLPGNQWPERRYYAQWSSMVGYFLQQHAARTTEIAVRTPGTISVYENLPLVVAEGWRP